MIETWSYSAAPAGGAGQEERILDNLLVRIHFIIVMVRLTGLAP